MAGLFPQLCDACRLKMVQAAVDSRGQVCFCDHRPPNRQGAGVLMVSFFTGEGFDSRMVAHITKGEAKEFVKLMVEET